MNFCPLNFPKDLRTSQRQRSSKSQRKTSLNRAKVKLAYTN